MRILKPVILIAAIICFIGVCAFRLSVFYHNRAIGYYDRKAYDDVVLYLNRALKINPFSAVSHYYLGNVYRETNQKEKAKQEYLAALKRNHRYTEAYYDLARLYREEKQYEEMLSLLHKALVSGAAQAEIKKLISAAAREYSFDLLDRSLLFFLSNQRQEAYEVIKKVLTIDPNFLQAQYMLGFFYYSDKKYTEAIQAANKAIALDPDFWSAYKLLGDIFFDEGDYRKAASQYKAALSFNDKDSSVYNSLGLAYMNMENYDEAIIYLEKAMYLAPINVDIRYNLASVYRDKGHLDAAIDHYKKVIAMRFNYPHVHNDLGDIYQQQGRIQYALGEYLLEIESAREKLLDNPVHSETLNSLAQAYNGIGKYEKAKKTIEKVIAQDPSYREAYITLAKIKENMNDVKGAVVSLEKAKLLSLGRDFINRDLERLKNKSMSVSLDKVYLKNGRMIEGKIVQESGQRIILEIKIGQSHANVPLERLNIDRIIRESEVSQK